MKNVFKTVIVTIGIYGGCLYYGKLLYDSIVDIAEEIRTRKMKRKNKYIFNLCNEIKD